MQTMDMSIASLVKQGKISQQLAFERCHDPDELQRLVGGASIGSGNFNDGYDSVPSGSFGGSTFGGG
jgi:hypothetical protein